MSKIIRKNPFKVIAIVQNISDEMHFERQGKENLIKRVLTLETLDNQVFYAELRNEKLYLLTKNRINEKDKVQVTFTFQGSEKNNKIYNNIYLKDIIKI